MMDEEIEMKDLSSMVKWAIRWRVKQDLANNNITRAACVPANVSVHNDLSDMPLTYNSAYISDQLSKYHFYKHNKLFPKKHSYWLYNDRGERKRKKPASLSEIKNAIETQIAERKEKLRQILVREQTKMENLEKDQQNYELKKEFHMVQMCINHAAKLRTDFDNLTTPIKLEILELHSQLIMLLERTKIASLKERSKFYRRIRYYCSYASRVMPELGAEYIKDEIMDMMGDTDPLGEYSAVLEEAIQQLEMYEEENKARRF